MEKCHPLDSGFLSLSLFLWLMIFVNESVISLDLNKRHEHGRMFDPANNIPERALPHETRFRCFLLDDQIDVL